MMKTRPGGAETLSVQVLGIGIRGCRIAMEKPLEVGDEFLLIMNHHGEEIIALVAVRYWHPEGFAGLQFTSMSERARSRLKLLVEKISGNLSQNKADSCS